MESTSSTPTPEEQAIFDSLRKVHEDIVFDAMEDDYDAFICVDGEELTVAEFMERYGKKPKPKKPKPKY